MTETVEKKEPEPMQIILKAVYGYLDSVVMDRWTDKGLRFTASGKTRIGQIFGWIAGLHASGVTEMQDFAARCAKSICENLDYLANYGGKVENNIPRYIVELSDDGTFGGFSVLWFIAVSPERQADTTGPIPEEKYKKEYDRTWGPRYRYVFSFNGGLLYHGPGGGEVFSVTLEPCLWSVHT